ncbi:MAG TPA: hypothetical protein VKS78_02985 [Roseiarcus sp.]|nr:hypothetical protein [Roseiarcus sp.]
MPYFVNQTAFDDPNNWRRAQGVDLNPKNAIVDPRGNVLAYAQTGGMIAPSRFALTSGQKIYRFGGAGRTTRDVATGAWWVEQRQFEILLSFAQTHDLALGMAVRLLCLAPPEWSDISLLVRARIVRDLLAWRGLANTVVIPATAGNPTVRLPHQNEIAARRLAQLFIPGLDGPGTARAAIQIENDYPLDAEASRRGFLYL